jgi:hypothetical protein
MLCILCRSFYLSIAFSGGLGNGPIFITQGEIGFQVALEVATKEWDDGVLFVWPAMYLARCNTKHRARQS